MTKKIYTFCNIGHSASEEYQIQNHPILAIDEDGKVVGHWTSSHHSFGKSDILTSIKDAGLDYPYETVWVDEPMNHPVTARLISQWNAFG
jgi:hypothetical protein